MKKVTKIITSTFAILSMFMFTLALLANVQGANQPILLLITGAFALMCVGLYLKNRNED